MSENFPLDKFKFNCSPERRFCVLLITFCISYSLIFYIYSNIARFNIFRLCLMFYFTSVCLFYVLNASYPFCYKYHISSVRHFQKKFLIIKQKNSWRTYVHIHNQALNIRSDYEYSINLLGWLHTVKTILKLDQ